MGEIRYLADAFKKPEVRDGAQMLRSVADRIESGEIKADNFALVWEQKYGEEGTAVSFNVCGQMKLTYLVGLLERAKTTIHMKSLIGTF